MFGTTFRSADNALHDDSFDQVFSGNRQRGGGAKSLVVTQRRLLLLLLVPLPAPGVGGHAGAGGRG